MSQAISDRYGLPLSTSSPSAAEHYVNAIDAICSQTYGAGAELGLALEVDDGFAMGHATLALASMFGYDPVKAKGHLADTHARATGLSRREQQQIAIINTWINGNSPRALEMIREHFLDFPRDIVLLRLAQRLFVAGCSGSGVAHYPPDFYAMMKALESDYGDDWAFQGQFAWATHEVGMLDEGLRLAQRSLELRPTNAVAAHSVAHVFYERADHSSGADFLGDWLEGYDRRIAYHVHLSWHQALFQLGMGHYQQVASLYENDIRPSVMACSANSLADSASLMWRWFLYTGSYSPFPWAELRDQADAAVQDPGLPSATATQLWPLPPPETKTALAASSRMARHGQQRQRPSSRGGPAPDGRHQRLRPRRLRPIRRPPQGCPTPTTAHRRQPRPARGLRRHPVGSLPPSRAVRRRPSPPPDPPSPALLSPRRVLPRPSPSRHQPTHRHRHSSEGQGALADGGCG